MPMHTEEVEKIECPVRGIKVAILVCHSCPNCLRVLFRSEYPPEYQCMSWRRKLDLGSGEEAGGGRVRRGSEPDGPLAQDGSASLDATWPCKPPTDERP